MIDLNKVTTSDLVEELIKREGVDARYIVFGDEKSIEVEGSAVVLIVTD